MEELLSLRHNKIMTKVPNGETVPGDYLTIDDFLKYFGLSQTEIDNLSDEIKQRYIDMVSSGNNTVETALYKYNDEIPINTTDEAFIYAQSMALHWALYQKAVAESSPNKKDMLEAWNVDKTQLIEVLKAQPQQTTIRKVVGSRFDEDEILPYSQSYGVSDLL